MRTTPLFTTMLCGLGILLTASSASAQRYTFERSFDIASAAVLDVVTERGAIEIHAGKADRVVVTGTVTVRIGVTTPVNGVELAKAVAASPPVQREKSTVRLRPPMGDAERRAVTVSYQVEVPPGTSVTATSDSGATTVTGLKGAVAITTQSAAIHLAQLGGAVIVTTGSGAVDATQMAGMMVVTTRSSAFNGDGLGGGLTLQTSSGEVHAAFTAAAPVSIQTGSSAIRLVNVRGPLRTTSRSGRMTVSGVPAGAWELANGSGSMELTLARYSPMTVDLVTGSGSIALQGIAVQGNVSKQRVTGTVSGGGPVVHAATRSGSLVIKHGPVS
jgi:hypothetical protein